MLCCGRKNDIPKHQTNTLSKVNSTNHTTIRATKFYDVDDKNEVVLAKDYSLVKSSNIKGISKITRSENYAVEVNKINSSKSGDAKQLDFSLDQEPGVSNTFDIPTFDYHTMLTHNIYANKNSSIALPDEDNKHKNNKRQSQTL